MEGASRISRIRCQASTETPSSLTRSSGVKHQPKQHRSHEPTRGLEPLTARLQVGCATNCATSAGHGRKSRNKHRDNAADNRAARGCVVTRLRYVTYPSRRGTPGEEQLHRADGARVLSIPLQHPPGDARDPGRRVTAFPAVPPSSASTGHGDVSKLEEGAHRRRAGAVEVGLASAVGGPVSHQRVSP
jgi:hypothetical protein